MAVQSTAIGTSADQTGTLTLSGAGSTGPTPERAAPAASRRAPAARQTGQGTISVTQGALLSGSDTDVLGVTAGHTGSL